MTDLLDIPKDNNKAYKVLEIGTGSGFQAAILSQIAKEVYTIEIVDALYKSASKVFQDLKLNNIQSINADGYIGWAKHAPFDGIIVTAAASHVPPPLINQLKTGGKMVIPVGSVFQVQHLIVIEKKEDNKLKTTKILPVRFVPFTGSIDENKP